MSVPRRTLGSQGLQVSAIGLGCMGMTAFYGDFDRRETEESSIETIGKALGLGINFLDTAWIYQSFGAGGGGNFTNEELVGKALKRYGRENFIVATKFGIGHDSNNQRIICGKPDFIRQQLQDSLTRLGVEYVDLYYQHRIDPDTPIEETMECLKQLVEEGKIKYIGLSEVTPAELRRAHAIHPVTAIQMEWSLTTRDAETTVFPVARELGVGIVAYSPLGRGLLTGAVKSAEELGSTDSRRNLPRFQSGTIGKNLPTDFFEIAKAKNVTPAQLALAWVLERGEDVVPIPGTKSIERLIENAESVNIHLTPDEWLQVEAAIPEIEGDRYPNNSGHFNNRL